MAEENKTVKIGGKQVPVVETDYEDIFTDMTDIAKGAANVGINVLNTPSFLLNTPQYIAEMVSGEEINMPEAPVIPNFQLSTPERQALSDLASLGTDVVLFPKAVVKIATQYPRIAKVLDQVFPGTFGTFNRIRKGESFDEKGLIAKIKQFMGDKKGREDLRRNLAIYAGLGAAYEDSDLEKEETERKVPVDMSTGGDPEDALFDQMNVPPSVLEQANVFDDPQMEEIELANFGKVPLWAIAGLKKADIGSLPEKAKKFLETLRNKIGSADEVQAKDDIVDVDITSEGTTVGIPKSKKTIIDSPEPTEGQFYSGLEARLMDPNTPEVFDDPISLMAFLQQKNISKVELEDNLLLPYLKEMAGQPIPKAELLDIIRKAPLRKIKSSTYGFRSDVLDGETKRAYYGSQYLYNKQGAPKGALENTYRERVLTLAPDEIPQDVGSIPATAHDFPDKYVIGWKREFDIELPKKVTQAEAQAAAGQGIKGLATANRKTIERNQEKLNRQLRGLYASAYEKLRREFGGPPSETMNPADIAQSVNMRESSLENLDPALNRQIKQFRSKLQSDINKLREFEKVGKEKYTFVDEIQSDLLQQSQKLKERILEDFGDSLKNIKTKQDARSFIAAGGRGDQADREVAALFARHGDVFRPIFRTEQEMSKFMKRFDENQRAFEQLASEGIRPSKETIQKAQEAEMIEKAMMENLETQLSEAVLKKLFPNLPLKNRQEWGEIMLKRAFSDGSKRLFEEGDPNAPIGLIINTGRNNKNKYGQTGGTDTPYAERTKDMKGIGMEEFYGGPDAKTPEGKHFTSPVEKALKRIAAENNTKLEIIEINGTKHYKLLFTPEGTQPHKTHRKKGGVVYNQEIIDIFEEA